MTNPLPNFENPPVVEVALTVRFEPIRRLTGPQIGHFWSSLGDDYSRIEEVSPIPPDAEDSEEGDPRSGQSSFYFSLGNRPASPRILLVHKDDNYLIQVQRDAFAVNWRRPSDKPDERYPRYPTVRELFDEKFDAFNAFLANRGLGEVSPTLCTVTYVNQLLMPTKGQQAFDFLPEALAVLQKPIASAEILNHAEDFMLAFRYKFEQEGKPIGRLYLEVTPRLGAEASPMYLLTLTAKGSPLNTKDKSGILAFFDVGRSWIVNGFAEATTPEMHRVWGRSDSQ